MIEKWPKVTSDYLGDYYIFRLRQDVSISPRTGRSHRFYILDAPDWVNVIPLTPEGEVIFVQQYRHGDESITLEIPAGMCDGRDGSALAAAQRELREETGYVAGQVVHLGSAAPNPAFLNNRCHSYLALDIQQIEPPQLDGSEDITLVTLPLARVREMIASGQITHSLTIAAFYYLDLYWRAGG